MKLHMSTLQLALAATFLLLNEVVVADYLAVNCGGQTYPDGGIPQYYDGVTFGAGPDYSPSNAHTDSSGIQWRADAFYSGTSTHVTDYRGVTYANTDDPSLYQTERYGMDFYYTLNVPNGQYTVELRFAESRFSSASSRVFSIAINGQQVEGQLDIFASAGGQNTAYISQYQATVSNGLLDILFNSIVYEAKVSAIRVFTNGGGSPLPSPPSSVTIAAGGGGDQYYKGGSTGATQSAAFPNYRIGALFEYLLNLQNGDYVVSFAFVEPQYTSPGARSFDVYIQNFKRISGFDIVANGGSGSSAVTVQRTVHVSNGLLRLKFQDAGSDAVVSGITVSPLTSSTGVQVAINCGSPLDVLGGLGIIFQKDTYYSGGNALITKPYEVFLPFGGFWDDFIYTDSRTGDFSYSVPVPNGPYQVEMQFTETEGKAAGQRVFSVNIQGQTVFQSLDIVASTGGSLYPIVLTADATVSDGVLKIDFVNNAIVQAIYIYPGLSGSGQSSVPSLAPAAAPSPIGSSAAPSPKSSSSTVPLSAPSTGSNTCAGNGGRSGTDCTGGCPAYSASNSIAVNCGGDNYVSSCGVNFLSDDTPCNPGDTIPDGAPYCRTNIKGPAGGYSYVKPSTDPPVTGTADPHIFESERIGFNTYFFRVDNGVYTVNTYFAEISGSDPSIDVNAAGLRRFSLIFNDDPNSPNPNIDPFALAGNQKFKADPTQTAQVSVTNGVLKMQLFPTGIRDAPAIKGIWVRKTG